MIKNKNGLFIVLLFFITLDSYGFSRKKPQPEPPAAPVPIEEPAPVPAPPPPPVVEEPPPVTPPPPAEVFRPDLPFKDRNSNALSGTSFISQASGSGSARESQIFDEIISGNIPIFLRKWIPVHSKITTQNGEFSELIFYVLPDYLSIGENSNFVRIPMYSVTAQKILNHLDLFMPTRKMVNLIFEESRSRFQPEPLTPGSEMSSNSYYKNHQDKIESQRMKKNFSLGDLFVGIKKDIVLSRLLSERRDRIAIYGWHYTNGQPIQNLNVSSHVKTYVDYSHGVRLVASEVVLDGKIMSIKDVFTHPEYSKHLSDEGVILDTKVAY